MAKKKKKKTIRIRVLPSGKVDPRDRHLLPKRFRQSDILAAITDNGKEKSPQQLVQEILDAEARQQLGFFDELFLPKGSKLTPDIIPDRPSLASSLGASDTSRTGRALNFGQKTIDFLSDTGGDLNTPGQLRPRTILAGQPDLQGVSLLDVALAAAPVTGVLKAGKKAKRGVKAAKSVARAVAGAKKVETVGERISRLTKNALRSPKNARSHANALKRLLRETNDPGVRRKVIADLKKISRKFPKATSLSRSVSEVEQANFGALRTKEGLSKGKILPPNRPGPAKTIEDTAIVRSSRPVSKRLPGKTEAEQISAGRDIIEKRARNAIAPVARSGPEPVINIAALRTKPGLNPNPTTEGVLRRGIPESQALSGPGGGPLAVRPSSGGELANTVRGPGVRVGGSSAASARATEEAVASGRAAGGAGGGAGEPPQRPSTRLLPEPPPEPTAAETEALNAAAKGKKAPKSSKPKASLPRKALIAIGAGTNAAFIGKAIKDEFFNNTVPIAENLRAAEELKAAKEAIAQEKARLRGNELLRGVKSRQDAEQLFGPTFERLKQAPVQLRERVRRQSELIRAAGDDRQSRVRAINALYPEDFKSIIPQLLPQTPEAKARLAVESLANA